MKLREPRTADMLVYAWLVVVIYVRLATNCALAARELARGHGELGAAITAFTVLHLLVVVFLLIFLSTTLSLGAGGLDRRRLTVLGASLGTRVAAEIVDSVAHPMTIVVGLFIVPLVFPIAHMPDAGGIVAALVIAVVAVFFAAQALGGLLSLSPTAHRLAAGFRFLFAAVMLALVAANLDFNWDAAGVRVTVFRTPFLLDDGSGGGLLAALRPWSPSSRVVGGGVLACAVFAIVCLGLYALALCATPRPAATAAFGRSAPTAAPAGDATDIIRRKELVLLLRSGPALVAVAAGVGSAAWLAAARVATAGIPLLGCFVIVLAQFGAAANLFGREGRALQRYTLLGVDWRMIFAMKNGAWLLVTGGVMVPPIVVAALRVSVGAAAALLLSAALALSLCVLWGNISSLLFPSAERARRGGAFVNQLAPFLIAAIPFAIHRDVAPFGSAGFDAAVAACVAVSIVLHARLRARIGRTLDAEIESVVARF